MTVAKTVYSSASGRVKQYIELVGTAAEVLQALADEHVQLNQIVVMDVDSTYAVYVKG